ncbi:MAG: hypothetical protein ACR2GO_07940 [Candidatus Limnocylindria bacterium]
MTIGPGVAQTKGGGIMFSVAVKGCGIIIWEGDGQWRTFAATEALSATLATRVETALECAPVGASEYEMREALLSIAGAGLFSADCEHGPGQCDGETSSS